MPNLDTAGDARSSLVVASMSGPGTPFHDPEADHALFSTLKTKLNPDITVIESDHPINHPTFAHLCARLLRDDLNANPPPPTANGRT